ncbi:MAG: cupin domain-containing protein [Bacteroidota bacterium]|nr:cupin domain-containing protein [Bacteroidota bacterium]
MSRERITATSSKEFIKNDSVKWEVMAEGIRRKVMAYAEQIMLVRVEFESGGIGSVHKHSQIQVTNVESGVFEIEISGEKKILKPGDAFYIPSNSLHGAVCIEAGVLVDVFSPMREDFIEKK